MNYIWLISGLLLCFFLQEKNFVIFVVGSVSLALFICLL